MALVEQAAAAAAKAAVKKEGGGFSRLVKYATTFSIGYGLFLGAVQPPRQPKDLDEAKDQAKPLSLLKNLGRDAVIAFGDDILALPVTKVIGKIFPKTRAVTDVIAGGIVAVGGGIAGTLVTHDVANFLEARSIARASGQAMNLPDYRMNAIDGFQSSGAGRIIRQQMTGISSPSAQAVYHQVTHNPYANLLSGFIRDDDEKQSGESPARNPVRFGIGMGTIASTLTFLGTAKYGFGKSTFASMGAGVAAGAFAVSRSGAESDQKMQGYAAVLEGAVPTAALFGGLTGLRALRGLKGKMGWLGAFGGFADKNIDRLAGTIGRVGQEHGPQSVERLLAKTNMGGAAVSRAQKDFMSSKFFQDFSAGAAAKAQGIGWHSAQSSTFGRPVRMMGSAMRGAIEGGNKALDYATNKMLFPLLRHSGSLEAIPGVSHGSTRWEQNLALAHLTALAPHIYNQTRGFVSGTYDTYGIGEDMPAPTKRKTHATSSMASNRRRQ